MKQEEKRFSVRFPLTVLESVKQAAQEDKRSINSEILWLVGKGLAFRKGKEQRDKSI